MFRRALATIVPIVVLSGAPAYAQSTPSTPCSALQTPDTMTVGGGSPQTAKTGSAFADPLQVTLSSTSGCPVTDAGGIGVTFSAPASGASGTFASTGTATATVGATSSGMVQAPAFTAGAVAGQYEVVATSEFGAVDFTLTNTATGVGVGIDPTAGQVQSATVSTAYATPLAATVLDAGGAPVSGAQVTFAVVAESGAGATFAGGAPNAIATTGTNGVATAPILMANSTTGSFTVVATTPDVSGSASFSLTNLASAPTSVVAGPAGSESTEAGSAFTIPLAVTVTDTDHNAVTGAAVTFSAPTSGPSGTFSGAHSVTVRTDADGVATAPPFTANRLAGGYAVTASVAGVDTQAAFALVNTPASLQAWAVASDGGVFTIGDAGFYGSTGGLHLVAPVVGIAVTPSGHGYWLVASDGGVFAFGDARFFGSTGGLHLVAPVVGIAATPSGHGYWLVASDGGVFAFGDARYWGSPAGQRIVGIAPDATGGGYWLAAADGLVLAFGDAPTLGSVAPAQAASAALASTASGKGYWVVGADGTVWAFGSAVGVGSANVQGAVGIAGTPDGAGAVVVTAGGQVLALGSAAASTPPSNVPSSSVVGVAT